MKTYRWICECSPPYPDARSICRELGKAIQVFCRALLEAFRLQSDHAAKQRKLKLEQHMFLLLSISTCIHNKGLREVVSDLGSDSSTVRCRCMSYVLRIQTDRMLHVLFLIESVCFVALVISLKLHPNTPEHANCFLPS